LFTVTKHFAHFSGFSIPLLLANQAYSALERPLICATMLFTRYALRSQVRTPLTFHSCDKVPLNIIVTLGLPLDISAVIERVGKFSEMSNSFYSRIPTDRETSGRCARRCWVRYFLAFLPWQFRMLY